MEEYKGLCILATNMCKEIDNVFLRFIRFTIDFPMPDVDQRKAIWYTSFEPKATSDSIDFNFLAKQFNIYCRA